MTDAMPYSITLGDLRAANPCHSRLDAATAAIKAWPATADDAFAAGVTVDDVLWIALAVASKRGDAELLRRLRHCMADIAAEALPIYEKHAPGDMRVRDCITAIRKFAQGEIGRDDMAAASAAARSAASAAAWAAARAAASAAASDAAWAAASAAARAAAWDAARNAASDAAWYAARAAAWDAARNAAWAAASDAAWYAASAAARATQKAIICRWLSDTPPVQAEEEA